MNILISGATGFIGRCLTESLTKSGHSVHALSRNAQATNISMPELVNVIEWHPSTTDRSNYDVGNIDAVINLAGESVKGRWTKKKKNAIRESRIASTRNLIESISKSSKIPKTLISASAVGIYGNRGEETLTEISSIGTGFLSEATDAWEKEALKAETLPVRLVTLRMGIVLGLGGGALPSMLPLSKLGLGGPLGKGSQWWPWIHIYDLIGIIRHFLETDAEGTFNATSPYPTRQKEFSQALGSALGRPAFIPTPGTILKLGLGEFSSELLYSRRALPERTLKSGYKFKYTKIESALHDLVSSNK